MSDQLFDFKVRDDSCTGIVPEGKYGVAHAIYLAAIGVATYRMALAHRLVRAAARLIRLKRRAPQ